MTHYNLKNVAEEQLAVREQDHTRDELFRALKRSRYQTGGITLHEISEIMATALDPVELQILAEHILMKKDQ